MPLQKRRVRVNLRRVTAYLNEEEWDWVVSGAAAQQQTVSAYLGNLVHDAQAAEAWRLAAEANDEEKLERAAW